MRRLLPLLCLLALPLAAPASERIFRPADWLAPLALAGPPSVFTDQDRCARHFLRFADLAHEAGDDALAEGFVDTAAACYGHNRSAIPARYLDALRAHPDNLGLRNAAAWALLLSAKGQAPAALALMAPIPPDKHTPETLDTLALAQLRCGQKVDALQTYLRALDCLTEDDPALCAYYDRFGDILYANGRNREALIAWHRAALLFQDLLDAGHDPTLLLIDYDPSSPHTKIRALRLIHPDL